MYVQHDRKEAARLCSFEGGIRVMTMMIDPRGDDVFGEETHLIEQVDG
jgi:hypothetical protein